MTATPTSDPLPSDLENRHSLIERSPVPMAELEGEGHIVRYVNPALCRLVGKSKKALLGNPFAETMEEGDGFLAVLDRVYRTGEAETHTEPEHLGPHPVYWSYAMWPVVGADQHPAAVMMQVTETTRFHQQAGAMNEALVLSSMRQHELTEAAEKLNERLRGKSPTARPPTKRCARARRDTECCSRLSMRASASSRRSKPGLRRADRFSLPLCQSSLCGAERRRRCGREDHPRGVSGRAAGMVRYL